MTAHKFQRLRHARRVGKRQIVLRLDRHARRDLDFSLPFAMQTKGFLCVIHSASFQKEERLL